MAEVIANILSSSDGTIATLSSSINSSVESISVSAPAPTPLQAGEFRIRIGNELMLVTAGASGTTWTVARAVEGSTAASHSAGASVRHVLTAGAIAALISAGGGGGTEPDQINITALLTGIQDGDPIAWNLSESRFEPGELVPE